MKKSYLKSKFLRLLVGATLSCITGELVPVIILSVIGSSVDSNAIAAYYLLYPILTFMSFIALLITIGSCVMMTTTNGEGDINSSNGIFTFSFVCLILVTTIALFVMLLFPEFVQSLLFSTTDLAVKEYVDSIYVYSILYACLLVPFNTFFSMIIMNEGNVKLVSASCITTIVLTLVGSMFFSGNFVGILISEVIGACASLIIILFHFLSKKNTIRLHFRFKLFYLVQIIRFSLPDASNFLFSTVFVVLLNHYLTKNAPVEYISVFGVLQTIMLLCGMFLDGIGLALEPIVSIYYNEGNTKGVIKSMNHSLKYAVGEGLALSGIMIAFRYIFAALYGFEGAAAELMSEAFFALSLSLTFNSILLLIISYFNYIGKIFFAVSLNFLNLLAVPCIYMSVLNSMFDISGIWYIYFASSFLVCLVVSLVMLVYSKKTNSKWLVDYKKDAMVYDYDYVLGTNQWQDISSEITAVLQKQGYSEKVIMKAQLVIEEHEMILLSQLKGSKKAIICEATLYMGDKVSMCIRDTSGTYIDKDKYDVFSDFMVTFAAKQDTIKSIGDNRVIYELN